MFKQNIRGEIDIWFIFYECYIYYIDIQLSNAAASNVIDTPSGTKTWSDNHQNTVASNIISI